jgi:hypothetical protein
VGLDPMSLVNGTASIDWDVSFSPIVRTIDDFDRVSQSGERFGVSSQVRAHARRSE